MYGVVGRSIPIIFISSSKKYHTHFASVSLNFVEVVFFYVFELSPGM